MLFRWEYYAWVAVAIAILAALAAYVIFVHVIRGDTIQTDPHAWLVPNPESPGFQWNQRTVYEFQIVGNRQEVELRLPERAPGTSSPNSSYLRFAPDGNPDDPVCFTSQQTFPEDSKRTYRSDQRVALIACGLTDSAPTLPGTPTRTPTLTPVDPFTTQRVTIELRSAAKPAYLLRRYSVPVGGPLANNIGLTPVPPPYATPTIAGPADFVRPPDNLWSRSDADGISLYWNAAQRATSYDVQRRYCPEAMCDAVWMTVAHVPHHGGRTVEFVDNSPAVGDEPKNLFAYRLSTVSGNFQSSWGEPMVVPLDVAALDPSEMNTLAWAMPDLASGTQAVVWRSVGGSPYVRAAEVDNSDLIGAMREGWIETDTDVRDADGDYLGERVCYRVQLVTVGDGEAHGLHWPAVGQDASCVPEVPVLEMSLSCQSRGMSLAWTPAAATLAGERFTHYDVEYQVTFAANVAEAVRENTDDVSELFDDPRNYTVRDRVTNRFAVPILPEWVSSAGVAGGYRADVRLTAHYEADGMLPAERRYCLSEYPTATPTPVVTMPGVRLLSCVPLEDPLIGATMRISWAYVEADDQEGTFEHYIVSQVVGMTVTELATTQETTWEGNVEGAVLATLRVEAVYELESGDTVEVQVGSDVTCTGAQPGPVQNLVLDQCEYDDDTLTITASVSWDRSPDVTAAGTLSMYRLLVAPGDQEIDQDPTNVTALLNVVIPENVRRLVTVRVAALYVTAGSPPVLSDPSNAVACSAGVPEAPTGVTAGSALGGVVIEWETSTDLSITGYHVLRRLQGAADLRGVSNRLPTSPTTWSDTTAISGQTYEYAVVAENANGLSAPSAIVTVTVP